MTEFLVPRLRLWSEGCPIELCGVRRLIGVRMLVLLAVEVEAPWGVELTHEGWGRGGLVLQTVEKQVILEEPRLLSVRVRRVQSWLGRLVEVQTRVTRFLLRFCVPLSKVRIFGEFIVIVSINNFNIDLYHICSTGVSLYALALSLNFLPFDFESLSLLLSVILDLLVQLIYRAGQECHPLWPRKQNVWIW